MYSILSEDGSWILTYHEGEDDPEELTPQEFAERYGEDALPSGGISEKDANQSSTITPVNELEDTMRYYESLRRLCIVCGKYSGLDHRFMNELFDVPEVDLYMRDAFEARHQRVTRLEEELTGKEIEAKACARNFSYWHQRVGFGELCDVDRDYLISYLKDKKFRAKMYYYINRYSKKEELVSLNDLMHKIFKLFLNKHTLPVPR